MTNNPNNGESHDLNAEQAVIACVLMDVDQLHDVLGILSSADFYDPINASIFKTIEILTDEQNPVDIFTISDRMSTNFECKRKDLEDLSRATEFLSAAPFAKLD